MKGVNPEHRNPVKEFEFVQAQKLEVLALHHKNLI